MPNFQTAFLEPLAYPLSFGDTHFECVAFSPRGERLILCCIQGAELLLRVMPKSDGTFLVKGDKATRPSQAPLLQKALMDFRDATRAVEIHSNIEPKKFLHVKRSPHLKDLSFFAHSFKAEREVWLEVGFGSGRHLLHQAKKNPQIQFIGLEIHKPSIEQVLKQCELQGIENIMVMDYDARLFMEFLPSNSVGRIFVHFPVPWDKKPHRRVFSPAFVEEALRVLHVKGTLELRTDSQLYFEFALGVMMALSQADVHVHKNALLEISSKYEDRWRKMDKDIYDVTLTNEHMSEPTIAMDTLRFREPIDFSKLAKGFRAETLMGEDFFVHFEEIYTVDDNSGCIRLSFGAHERNEKAYVWIDTQGNARYLPKTILATKSNSAADQKIKEWFHGICH
jgi:tRNA (guanine-N7-)-methyltransferase